MTIGYMVLILSKMVRIYRFELEDLKGTIKEVQTGYEIEASTYLTRNENYLYAITKENENCGVASFKIMQNGDLELINKCLASKMEQDVIYKFQVITIIYLKLFMVLELHEFIS